MTSRRGTSNSNTRGSAKARRCRKRWLLSPESGFGGDGISVQCQFPGCTTMVTFDTLWVDRFPLPGIHGGRYVKGNIRPSCGLCNMRHGQELSMPPQALLTVPTTGRTVVAMTNDEAGEVLETVSIGVQRYQREGPPPRRWRWAAVVERNGKWSMLFGYETKRDALSAGEAYLREQGITPPTTTERI